jgi:LytS/YehU family sensor histidine kinase
MRQEDADRMLGADEGQHYARARIGHYAISNIKQRLALRYGEAARLEIRSDPDVGTEVRVELPAIEPPEGQSAENAPDNLLPAGPPAAGREGEKP